MSTGSGYECIWHGPDDPSDIVLGGDFMINRVSNGMSVHVTSGLEMSDTSSEFTVGPSLSIFLLLEGYAAFTIDGETWELGAGDDVNAETGLIWSRARNTRIVRHTRRGRYVSKVAITLKPEWFDTLDVPMPVGLEAFRARHLAEMHWCPSPRAIRNAHEIVRPIGGSQLQRRMTIHRNALQIVQEAFELFDQDSADGTETDIPARATAIRSYIDATLEQDLPLDEIGRALGMSTTVMQDRFRDAFDMTVGEYRRRQRLVRALVALRDHGVSVGKAAELAGYRSPANFATAFSRQFGFPPSSVRN
ncbi:MAG: AraC family transcriptional regulator [Pseudomonadota bacterium]